MALHVVDIFVCAAPVALRVHDLAHGVSMEMLTVHHMMQLGKGSKRAVHGAIHFIPTVRRRRELVELYHAYFMSSGDA